MSRSKNDLFKMINPTPGHFVEIQALCEKVYPFTKPWTIDQMEAHHAYFPEGQLIVIDTETNKVIGLAFSLIIAWSDYSPQDSWKDFTSAGYFHNHDPRKGKTLYGAEVMVDPDYRGRGIGKMLYRGRQEIARKFQLKRIRAGARLRGYAKFRDKFTPEEYTQQVVASNISDPTLSFQISQGFVVLDVAKNYLIHDPESLGYAAVIESLNPELATSRDYRKQQHFVDAFKNDQKFPIEFLPRELRRVVRKVSLHLGQTIRVYEGDKFYDIIENYRRKLKNFRSARNEINFDTIYDSLKKRNKKELLKITHAFSMLLELINVCESAYRTWRQRHKNSFNPMSFKTELSFVLTAHPTEARSNDVVFILREITRILVDGMHNDFRFNDAELNTQLGLLWQYPLVKTNKTTVLDEAEYIYSNIFSRPIFDFILTNKSSYNLKLSTWVGGDKDGHPGITKMTMTQCLTKSRSFLLDQIENNLSQIIPDLDMLYADKKMMKLKNKVVMLNRHLKQLRQLKAGDGKRLQQWKHEYAAFLKCAPIFIKRHYLIKNISRILELFPALVLPIELRENSVEIARAVADKSSSIWGMLKAIKEISSGSDMTAYARGLIISHCRGPQDLTNALLLVQSAASTKKLPILPLFEDRASLENADMILNKWLGNKAHLTQIKKHWNGKFEIMLGYSDSAKQIGVLPSRYLIRHSMFKIERVLKRLKLTPVFFHGSGGSVARGGGSLQEQIAWWPNSAVQLPKMTVQGEMIQRTFATPEILNSHCLHMSNEARIRRAKKAVYQEHALLEDFVNRIEKQYVQLVSDTKLLGFCLQATPYKYLSVLRLGSRPSSRPEATVSLDSLRAIPWILCWTQTRVLFPTWWGVGTAWVQLSKAKRSELKNYFKIDAFFASFVKVLGYTLAKVEMSIWRQYLEKTHGKKGLRVYDMFELEYKRAVKFVHEVSQSRKLIAHRPWLEESIRLRSPYVHILNLLQILAMQSHDEMLLKETLVGIACGMLETG